MATLIHLKVILTNLVICFNASIENVVLKNAMDGMEMHELKCHLALSSNKKSELTIAVTDVNEAKIKA